MHLEGSGEVELEGMGLEGSEQVNLGGGRIWTGVRWNRSGRI